MTLRRRVGIAAAIAVAIAVVLVACVSYFVVRGQLRGQVDDSLRTQAIAIQHGAELQEPLPGIPASAGGPAPYAQVVLADGTTFPRQGDLNLPVDGHVLAVAAGESRGYMTDIHVGGSHLRELAFPIPLEVRGQPVAIQLARPLSGVDHLLGKLRLILFALCLGGIALALVLGRIAARRVLSPLADVARTAEHIGATGDLSSRIQVRTEDEVGQLARRFNAMIGRLEASRSALDESVRAQRQLVADASHELRTPVTSLRTNIEVLLAHEQLGPDERRRMLSDVVEQTEELSTLVADLIELARGEVPAQSSESVRLDRLVSEAVDRAQRNFPAVRFEAELEPALVEAAPDRLGRAVNNLLDNAARHSPEGGRVEVLAGSEGVRVRDHGHGVAAEDLPYVFDRFYRGSGARGRQGSGLGLAIVKQVADQSGGEVSAANAPDGGAVFSLRLPGRPPDSADRLPDHPSLTGHPEALA